MPSRGEGVFHYSFSAPLQAVTEIMKNKDAAVLVSAAWQWALGGQGSGHGPALCQPPGAVLGSQSRQDEPARPQLGVSAQPVTVCLPLWQRGCRGQGPWGSCCSPSLQRQQGLPLTPACKAHLSRALLHKGSCGSGVPGPRTARAPAPLCPLSSGHTASSATAILGRVLLLKEDREEPTARHLLPLCASHRVEGPA